MDLVLVQKEICIDNKSFLIKKSIPLKPVDMYIFLKKTLNIEKNHPDFKHIFDYLESIKQCNDYYLLSILSIPQCPTNTNGLGNFFGHKMSNISKDLKIFPFGNVVVSHLSLVSKRTSNHNTLIILSLKGNKKLHDQHPSNAQQNNGVGYFIVDNWTNVVSKRYINYVYTNGLKNCVGDFFLNKKQNITDNIPSNITDNISSNITDNISSNINENINENNKEEKVKNINSEDMNNKDINNEDTKNIDIDIKNDDNNQEYHQLNFDNTYFKYQSEILDLKSLIFYLISNKGEIKSDINKLFNEDFLKKTFGNDYSFYLK
jgi:hypothetical protein